VRQFPAQTIKVKVKVTVTERQKHLDNDAHVA